MSNHFRVRRRYLPERDPHPLAALIVHHSDGELVNEMSIELAPDLTQALGRAFHLAMTVVEVIVKPIRMTTPTLCFYTYPYLSLLLP